MKIFNKLVSAVIHAVTGELSQEERKSLALGGTVAPLLADAALNAAQESAVLLKNDGDTLPLKDGETVALFGRVQLDWFYVGYGSGGDVNVPYTVNLVEGLRACPQVSLEATALAAYETWVGKHQADHGFWGHWPYSHPEMPLKKELVRSAARNADAAVVVIGRAAGEDRENKLKKGSWFLTDSEVKMLDAVTSEFKRVAVLLNCGSVMDMSWMDSYADKIGAVMYVWQGGMESGRAVANLLCGKVSPSGRLADTIACTYEDYPSSKNFGAKDFNCYAEDIFVGYRYFETFARDKVRYPFGYGLSYTSFEQASSKPVVKDANVSLSITVKNTGKYSGKNAVGVYYSAPQTDLGKPARQLAAYAKTRELMPGDEQELLLSFELNSMASFDDTGKTGYKNAFVLEKGEYRIYAGADVREAVYAGSIEQSNTVVTEQLSCVMPVVQGSEFRRMTRPACNCADVSPVYEQVHAGEDLRKERVLKGIYKEITPTGNKGIRFNDVVDGKASLEEFTAQLTDIELEALCRGDYTMNSPLGAKGNAGVLGGTVDTLREKGVPAITATDGPSGIRLAACASLAPIGTALACTWNEEAVTLLFGCVADEMLEKGTDILLAPGMNIHRDMLCGRNFEYFSEDPVLSGCSASAVVEGVQSRGVAACPKHFACNNQETNRNYNDSRVSGRALREIYLKGFEICVKRAKPLTVMTSYNKVNGVWSHYNYDLVTTVLRGEWGFSGCVMTDWWMRPDKDPDFPLLKNNAFRVRAGVDVLMPGAAPGTRKREYDPSLLESLGSEGRITRGEIQASAMHTLELTCKLQKQKLNGER